MPIVNKKYLICVDKSDHLFQSFGFHLFYFNSIGLKQRPCSIRVMLLSLRYFFAFHREKGLNSPLFANCPPLIHYHVYYTLIYLSLILCDFIYSRFTDSYQSLLPLIQNLSLDWTCHPANNSRLWQTLRTLYLNTLSTDFMAD